MRIQKLLGTTLLAAGVFFTQAIVPATAGVNDPSEADLLANPPAGTQALSSEGPNGFVIVQFFFLSNNQLQSQQESSTLNANSSTAGGNNNNNRDVAKEYGDSAAHLSAPFQNSPGGRDVFSTINNIRGVVGGSSVIGQANLAAARARRRELAAKVARLRAEAERLGDAAASIPVGNIFARQRAENAFAVANAQLQRAEAELAQLNTELTDDVIDIDFGAPDEPDVIIEGGKIQDLTDDDFDGPVFAREADRPASAPRAPSAPSEVEEVKSHRLKKGEGFVTGAVITPSAGKISGKFHVARPQARMPWALSLNANYTGLDDDRNNADRDADIWSVTGTGAIKINRKTVLGASLTFKDGDVKSSSLNSTLDGTYYGFNLFASHQLTKVVNVTAFGGYTHGENDIDLDGATGSFDSNIFNAGVQIQGRYFFGNGMRFNPDVSVGLINTKNDGFLASNGVDSDSTNITSFSASAGGTLSKIFASEKGTFTPSLGLHAIYEDSSGGDLQLINGTSLANRLGIGATVSPAISFTMANGATMGFNASYSQYAKDISSWTVGGSLKIPFN